MEKMFLDATNKTEDSATNLQKMITDESAIFDILGNCIPLLEYSEILDGISGTLCTVYTVK